MSEGTKKLTVPIKMDNDHIQGPVNAPISLVEYGDFECPYTGHAYPIVKQIKRKFGETLCFVFRNFPLAEIHPHAQQAAEAAEAAGGQKKFWEMHDILYENQQALDHYHLVEYATMLNLDVERFNNDIFGHKYAGHIHEDFISGVRSGVNGTPTFFINGMRYNGPLDYEPLLENLMYIVEQT